MSENTPPDPTGSKGHHETVPPREEAPAIAESAAIDEAGKDAFTATIRALEVTIDGLNHSNAQLKGRLERDWRLAKTILVVAGVIVSLVFGANVYREIVAVSEIRARSAELANQTKSAREQVDESRKSLAELAKDRGKLQIEWQEAKQQTADQFAVVAKAIGIGHSITSRVAESYRYLHVQTNPRLARIAIESAMQALSELEAMDTEYIPEASTNELALLVWHQRLQIDWAVGDAKSATESATRILELEPANDVALSIRGRARLLLALRERAESSSRERFIEMAIADLTDLESAAGQVRADFELLQARLSLVACRFVGRSHTGVQESARTLLRDCHTAAEVGDITANQYEWLSGLARSLLEVSKRLTREGDYHQIEWPAECSTMVCPFASADSEMHIRILLDTIENRTRLTEDHYTQIITARYCARVTQMLVDSLDQAGGVKLNTGGLTPCGASTEHLSGDILYCALLHEYDLRMPSVDAQTIVVDDEKTLGVFGELHEEADAGPAELAPVPEDTCDAGQNEDSVNETAQSDSRELYKVRWEEYEIRELTFSTPLPSELVEQPVLILIPTIHESVLDRNELADAHEHYVPSTYRPQSVYIPESSDGSTPTPEAEGDSV